jgi:cytochrome c oxidase assembly protein subunit 11
MTTASLPQKNKKVALSVLMMAAGMLGLGYASVPLYRLFCQVTGFAGTTQRVTEQEASRVAVADKTISIRFDGNVASDMPWYFVPEHSTDIVSLGERDMAIFIAKNNSDKPITGTATFNVEPEQTGQYFNKIQCFCFTEQTLQPGEEVRMPVLFYVDPKITEDENAKNVEQITLSYTFHRAVGSSS